MGLIYVPKRKIQRAFKPDFPIRARSNDANSALWLFGNPGLAVDLVSRNIASLNLDYVVENIYADGRAIKVHSAVLNRCDLGTPEASKFGANDFTVICRARLDATTGYAIVARWRAGSYPADNQWFLGANSGFGTTDCNFGVSNGSANTFAAGSAASKNTTEFWTWCGVRRGNTIFIRVYDDSGTLKSSGSTSFSGSVNNSSQKLTLGEISQNPSYSADTTTDYLYLVNGRGLSDEELRAIVLNRYSALAVSSRQPIWIPSAGGGPAAALSGSVDAQSIVTGSITTAIPLAGTLSAESVTGGLLTTGIPLAGQVAALSVADGALSAQITLAGSVLAEALASAGLTTGIQFVGQAAAASGISATLTTGIPLAGNLAASVATTGALSAQITLNGAAVAQALVQGGLLTAIPLAGAVAGVSAANASLLTGIPLTGGLQAEVAVQGALTTQPQGLAGEVQAQASAAAALSTQIPLAGTAQAWAAGAGSLSTLIALNGVAASVSGAAGSLILDIPLSGSVLAQALATGDLTTVIRLDGQALARAAASGLLDGSLSFVPRHTIRAQARTTTVHAQARTTTVRAILN